MTLSIDILYYAITKLCWAYQKEAWFLQSPFLGILSISFVHAKVLQPLQSQSQSPPPSLLNITSQKQFNEWEKESDQAEALGNYAAETNATDKMALTDCVNELVLSRNGTLDFAAVYSKLINTNSTARTTK